jgi:hypothetical protein
MRLPRVRFTVRWLMVAVAIVALAFPLFRMARFYRMHLHAALSHREWEKFHALELKNVALTEYAPSVSPQRRREMTEQSISRARNRQRYHAELKRKYERAATHPWDPVEPDPPMPE